MTNRLVSHKPDSGQMRGVSTGNAAAPNPIADSLGLDEETDSEAILLELESCFDIRFSRSELKGCRTVGDLYQVVRRRFTGPAVGVDGLGTALALHRLRQLCTLPMSAPFASDYRLPEIAQGLDADFDEVGRILPAQARGKTLRAPGRGMVSDIVGACCIAASALGLFMTGITRDALWLGAAGVVAMIGVLLLQLDPRPWGDADGALQAPRVAGLPLGPRPKDSAAYRDQVLWAVLVEMLADYTRLPKSEIRAGTLLLKARRGLSLHH